LLYTVSFGLLGDNRIDPPLAPTVRPRNSGSQEIINAQGEVEEAGRSWLSILTLGILG